MIRHNGITMDRKARVISHRGVDREFPHPHKGVDRVFPMLCHLILSAGMSKEMLFWQMFQDDPNGGPEDWKNWVSVGLVHLRERALDELRLELRSWKVAGVIYYYICPQYTLPVPKPVSRGNRRLGSHHAVYVSRAAFQQLERSKA